MTHPETDIQDDEIRVIGHEDRATPEAAFGLRPSRRVWGWVAAIVAAVAAALLGWAMWGGVRAVDEAAHEGEEIGYFEPEAGGGAVDTVRRACEPLGREVDSLAAGFIEVRDTTVNDIPLRICIPHNAELTLHVGPVDRCDPGILYAAQAADIRRDNRKIVGAFVLRGEPLAWGLSKKGYCAVVDGRITIGVADNSPLFEQATERGGYFFRQYPLVSDGRLVENEPKNKSIRRALCDRQGEIMMVDCSTPESFHDFAQALVDLGVVNAIYLVGSTSYGWWIGEEGERQEFGVERSPIPKNTSYIVWRRR